MKTKQSSPRPWFRPLSELTSFVDFVQWFCSRLVLRGRSKPIAPFQKPKALHRSGGSSCQSIEVVQDGSYQRYQLDGWWLVPNCVTNITSAGNRRNEKLSWVVHIGYLRWNTVLGTAQKLYRTITLQIMLRCLVPDILENCSPYH